MKSSRLRILAGGVLLMALFAGCTAGANPQEVVAAAEPAGFLLGLWHGFISLFAFVASLFVDGVGVYEVTNNGNWYNFGFVLGAMSFYGGGGGGASRGRRR
jgi:hypothetical protein